MPRAMPPLPSELDVVQQCIKMIEQETEGLFDAEVGPNGGFLEAPLEASLDRLLRMTLSENIGSFDNSLQQAVGAESGIVDAGPGGAPATAEQAPTDAADSQEPLQAVSTVGVDENQSSADPATPGTGGSSSVLRTSRLAQDTSQVDESAAATTETGVVDTLKRKLSMLSIGIRLLHAQIEEKSLQLLGTPAGQLFEEMPRANTSQESGAQSEDALERLRQSHSELKSRMTTLESENRRLQECARGATTKPQVSSPSRSGPRGASGATASGAGRVSSPSRGSPRGATGSRVFSPARNSPRGVGAATSATGGRDSARQPERRTGLSSTWGGGRSSPSGRSERHGAARGGSGTMPVGGPSRSHTGPSSGKPQAPSRGQRSARDINQREASPGAGRRDGHAGQGRSPGAASRSTPTRAPARSGRVGGVDKSPSRGEANRSEAPASKPPSQQNSHTAAAVVVPPPQQSATEAAPTQANGEVPKQPQSIPAPLGYPPGTEVPPARPRQPSPGVVVRQPAPTLLEAAVPQVMSPAYTLGRCRLPTDTRQQRSAVPQVMEATMREGSLSPPVPMPPPPVAAPRVLLSQTPLRGSRGDPSTSAGGSSGLASGDLHASLLTPRRVGSVVMPPAPATATVRASSRSAAAPQLFVAVPQVAATAVAAPVAPVTSAPVQLKGSTPKILAPGGSCTTPVVPPVVATRHAVGPRGSCGSSSAKLAG